MQYITPVKTSAAKDLVAEVYSQIKQDFGRVVEPFTMHSPIPSLLAGAWMASRESELVGVVPREIKEAIATSISKLNQCPYCVEAHTIMLQAIGKKNTAELITKEQYKKLDKPKTRKIVKWALATLSPEAEIIRSPPFEAEEAPEIIGTTVFYHYINPLVTIFLGKTPLTLPFLKPQMTQIASRLFKKAVNKPKTPGTSLNLLPDRKLPNDLSWAKTSPHVAGSYARFAGVIKDIEESLIPESTRKIVFGYLSENALKQLNFSSERIKEAATQLDPKSRIAATIALLTPISPHQINRAMINDFHKTFPSQTQLLGLTTWASFTRARIIGKWLNKHAKS